NKTRPVLTSHQSLREDLFRIWCCCSPARVIVTWSSSHAPSCKSVECPACDIIEDSFGVLCWCSLLRGNLQTQQQKRSVLKPFFLTSCIEEKEPLEARAVICKLPDTIQEDVHNLFADGIMATGKVVSRIFFSTEKPLPKQRNAWRWSRRGMVARCQDDLVVVDGEGNIEDIFRVADKAAGEAELAVPRARKCELADRGDDHILDKVGMVGEAAPGDAVFFCILCEVPQQDGFVTRRPRRSCQGVVNRSGDGYYHVGVAGPLSRAKPVLPPCLPAAAAFAQPSSLLRVSSSCCRCYYRVSRRRDKEKSHKEGIERL
ncbi:hypothetical protein KI387_041701, partial [Taxus chinensis]